MARRRRAPTLVFASKRAPYRSGTFRAEVWSRSTPSPRWKSMTAKGGSTRSLNHRANSSGDSSMGKLDFAIRHNYNPLFPGGDVTARETYHYGGPGGMPDSKTTVMSTGQTFSVSFTHDTMGDMATLAYPSCAGCGT